jgi:4-oxalocrotonate tautomerase
MLMLKLTLLEGRTEAQKAELIRRLTAAAELYLNEPSAHTRILIYEVPPTNWGQVVSPSSSANAGRTSIKREITMQLTTEEQALSDLIQQARVSNSPVEGKMENAASISLRYRIQEGVRVNGFKGYKPV